VDRLFHLLNTIGKEKACMVHIIKQTGFMDDNPTDLNLFLPANQLIRIVEDGISHLRIWMDDFTMVEKHLIWVGSNFIVRSVI